MIKLCPFQSLCISRLAVLQQNSCLKRTYYNAGNSTMVSHLADMESPVTLNTKIIPAFAFLHAASLPIYHIPFLRHDVFLKHDTFSLKYCV